MTNCNYSDCSSPEVKLIQHCPGPQAYKNMLKRPGYSKGSEIITQELTQGQSYKNRLSLKCTECEQARPAELTLYCTHFISLTSALEHKVLKEKNHTSIYVDR